MLSGDCPKCAINAPGQHPAGCTPETRFWRKLARVGACWEWQGCIKSHGYGVFQARTGRRPGKVVYAHRFAYEATFGDVPEGMEVMHLCDNRRCCRPAHLFVGTHTDNMRDASQKGRMVARRKGDRLPKTPEQRAAGVARAARVRAKRHATLAAEDNS